jgi:hypothetical protein
MLIRYLVAGLRFIDPSTVLTLIRFDLWHFLGQ